jgi:hypothetical protein
MLLVYNHINEISVDIYPRIESLNLFLLYQEVLYEYIMESRHLLEILVLMHISLSIFTAPASLLLAIM